MSNLNATARGTLRAYGVSVAEWRRRNHMGDKWLGDECGCPDDRCIGYHHDNAGDCGCLPALLAELEVTHMTQEPPDHVLLVDDAGEPVGTVDMKQLEADSARLCFEYAAAAGDPEELDRIAERWSQEFDEPAYLGYCASAALALMTTSVLDPLLVVLDEAAPQFRFREKLREMRDQMGGDG